MASKKKTTKSKEIIEKEPVVINENDIIPEEEAKNLYDERFEYMQTEVINFIEDLYTKRINLIINVQTNLLKNYKERDDIKLFLNIDTVLSVKSINRSLSSSLSP